MDAVVQLWGTMCCVNLQAAWPKEGDIPILKKNKINQQRQILLSMQSDPAVF